MKCENDRLNLGAFTIVMFIAIFFRFIKRLRKIKKTCVQSIFVACMVLEDIYGKEHLIHVFLPLVYWCTIIDTQTPSFFSINFGFLVFGIILGTLQLCLMYRYTTMTGKQRYSLGVTIFIGICILYGMLTAYFMSVGIKSNVIWMLISVYIIGFVAFWYRAIINYQQNPDKYWKYTKRTSKKIYKKS